MKTIPVRNLAAMKLSALVLFAGLLAGCASTPDLVNGRLIPPPGQAYLIVATTYEISQGVAINGESGVEIAGPDKPVSLMSTPGNRRIQAPGEEATKGALHLLAVPPGEYHILRAFGSYQESGFDVGVGYASGNHYNGVGVGIGTRTGGGRNTFAVPLKHTFQLQAGEVAYIGDVHILLDRIPSASVRINVRRDFNHMQSVWKVQDFSNVQIRPVSGMP